ncbi:unnamed protein product [Orchesella dallaii]|uniref:Glutathione S-transferase n=1 Tax=Orchesella dallaii TaxID=48710 RepID=A0ABP1R8V5_9HEXA
MTTAKLYYFDARGVAEPVRLILTYGGVEFEDIRAPLVSLPPVVPPGLKQKCTWGTFPLIEFEGKKLAQSLAMTRYFAKRFNLVPQDDFEAALCDEYVDATRDLYTAWVPALREEDANKREKILEETYESTKKRFMDVFESILELSPTGKHLVGDSLTWTDIYVAVVFNNLELVTKTDLLRAHPLLKSFSEQVFNEPKLKKWIQNRPDSMF